MPSPRLAKDSPHIWVRLSRTMKCAGCDYHIFVRSTALRVKSQDVLEPNFYCQECGRRISQLAQAVYLDIGGLAHLQWTPEDEDACYQAATELLRTELDADKLEASNG